PSSALDPSSAGAIAGSEPSRLRAAVRRHCFRRGCDDVPAVLLSRSSNRTRIRAIPLCPVLGQSGRGTAGSHLITFGAEWGLAREGRSHRAGCDFVGDTLSVIT